MRRQLSDFEDVDHPSVEDRCDCGVVLLEAEIDAGRCARCVEAALAKAAEDPEAAA